ncbi:uncharacterized protein isoform X2 [Rhodnius prolixus]|uniref:uncharacterized protein isoform X2 n=1 Tax=Rhodnius prolixus TaxID=13249 RepID=UPI003D18ED41
MFFTGKVCKRWEWRRIMDTDPSAIAPYTWIIQFVYTTISQIFYDIYNFFLQKWNWRVAEQIELLEWLEVVTGIKFHSLDEVWKRGGKALCFLIQERTNSITVNKITKSMYSAHYLAITQLGTPRVFNKKEVLEPKLNNALEKKFRKFLKNIKQALDLLQSVGSSGYRISEDIVARGVGLYAAYVGRRGTFSIYSMIDNSLEGVIVEMKGLGEAAVLIIGGEHFDGKIRLEYKQKRGKVLISYIVAEVGQYQLKISQNGFHVPGSPFEVHIEDAPVGYNGKFGAAEWYEPAEKLYPKVSKMFQINLERPRFSTNFEQIKRLSSKESMVLQSDSPERKALPLLSPPSSPSLEKKLNKLTDENQAAKLSNVASSLILARKFTTKLKTPFEINLENFHYFDNINALPNEMSNFTSNEIDSSLSPLHHDQKLILTMSSEKLQSCPNWIAVGQVDKKAHELHQLRRQSVPPPAAGSFNVWSSMTAFGPPYKSNPAANSISTNNLITTPHTTNTTATTSTTTVATYISPDGAAFPISFNQNETSSSFKNSFKTTFENNSLLDKSLINKDIDFQSPNDSFNFKDNSFNSMNSIEPNSSTINYSNDCIPHESNAVSLKNNQSTLNSSSLSEKTEGSDKLESSSSDETYRSSPKERVIELALKAEYEYTVFVPKASQRRKSENNDVEESITQEESKSTENSDSTRIKCLSVENQSRRKETENNKIKRNSKTKRRSSSVMSVLEPGHNQIKEKYNLRRTQSAISKFSSKSVTSAINYLKNRKKILIRIGEYARDSTEIIKSNKSVKKWKKYWDGLQYEKNVYNLDSKNCSLELDGIVAKGKYLFENMSQIGQSLRALPAKIQEVNNEAEITLENILVISEEDPERIQRFQTAKKMFTNLENSTKRIYRSLPTKFKQIEQPEEHRKRSNSECIASGRTVSERFQVTDLYKDIHEGLGAPGIPHRLAVLASLRSVEPKEEIELPGFSSQYPYIPTTPQNQYVHRPNIETLIPWGQIVSVNS